MYNSNDTDRSLPFAKIDSFQGAVPAQIIFTYMDTYKGHVRNQLDKSNWNLWNDLTYQSTGTLKFPGLGPPPTCPFIYNYNVKEPIKTQTTIFPAIATGENRCY